MEKSQLDSFNSRDEIINAFRPIELLLGIMDTSSTEIYGNLTHSFSEIGKELCQNFRRKLDVFLAQQKEGDTHDSE
jgi:hypothetical protein